MAENSPAGTDRVISFLQEGRSDELLRYLYRSVPHHAARDLLHEIWLRSNRNRGPLLAAKSPRAYLFGIAANVVRAYIRSSGSRLRMHLLQQEYEAPDTPFDLLAREEHIARITKALQLLPVEHAAVLHCVKGLGLSYSQTATRLGLTHHQVERYLHKAKVLMNELLDKETS